ncbi:MAG: protein-L-isoaspartate(D-aspartate) O-methyltransferase, partial [Polyangiaceae bacterium]
RNRVDSACCTMVSSPSDPVAAAREAMVEHQLRRRGIRDERVLDAMGRVPRHLFVPESKRAEAYADRPLPIGYAQTISQPLMVATMLEALELVGGEMVLEVGAGSGYQAAVLGTLARSVIALEIVPELVEQGRGNLSAAGIDNVEVRLADGGLGLVDEGPFSAIVVAAGAPVVPPPLVGQLAPGGRLVIPVDDGWGQMLTRIRRAEDGTTTTERLGGCAFVPLTGAHGR